MEATSKQISIEFLQVFSMAKGRLMQLVETHGLTLQQTFVLYRLYTDGTIVMGTLAKQLQCDASNVTGLVERLVAHKLIKRHAQADDHRAKQITLTAKGKTVVEKILGELPQSLNLDKLTPAERKSFYTLLKRIAT